MLVWGDKKDYPIATLDYVFMSRWWRSCCLNVQARWGPSEHRFVTGNGVRKDHAFLETTIRLRLTKAERVHRPDRKYWKTADGRVAVQAAWRKVAQKYDDAGASTIEQLEQTARGDSASGAELDGNESEPTAEINRERMDQFLMRDPADHISDGCVHVRDTAVATDNGVAADVQTFPSEDECLAQLHALGYGSSEDDATLSPDSETEETESVQELTPPQRVSAEAGLRNAGLTAAADDLRGAAGRLAHLNRAADALLEESLQRLSPDGGVTQPGTTQSQSASPARRVAGSAGGELLLDPQRSPGTLSAYELGLEDWLQRGRRDAQLANMGDAASSSDGATPARSGPDVPSGAAHSPFSDLGEQPPLAGQPGERAVRQAALDSRDARFVSIARECLRLLPAQRPMAASRFFSVSEETRKIKQRQRDRATKTKYSKRSKADCKEFNDSVRNDYRR